MADSERFHFVAELARVGQQAKQARSGKAASRTAAPVESRALDQERNKLEVHHVLRQRSAAKFRSPQQRSQQYARRVLRGRGANNGRRNISERAINKTRDDDLPLVPPLYLYSYLSTEPEGANRFELQLRVRSDALSSTRAFRPLSKPKKISPYPHSSGH